MGGNLSWRISIINNGNPKNFCTKYSNLSFSRIIISNQSFTDWEEVLNDIGKIYAEFRTKHKSEIFDTAVFGLPVMHLRLFLKSSNQESIISGM